MTPLSTTPKWSPHTTYTLGRSCWTSREYTTRIKTVISRQKDAKDDACEFQASSYIDRTQVSAQALTLTLIPFS